LNRANQLT